MVGGGEVVGLKTLDRTCTLIDASPLTSHYATSSSLALIAPHCFSLSLTLVHNSFLFSKTWNNIPAMCSRLWSLKCWGRSLIITFLIIFLNKFPRCKFHAWCRKIQVVPGEPRKTQTLESNCNKLQNSDVLGKRETFQSPSFFFWESASWIESAGMWRVNIRQNWKDIALDIGALRAFKHICVAFFALKFSLAGVEPVMFHQDLRQLGANGYSGCSFASRRRAKLFIAQ